MSGIAALADRSSCTDEFPPSSRRMIVVVDRQSLQASLSVHPQHDHCPAVYPPDPFCKRVPVDDQPCRTTGSATTRLAGDVRRCHRTSISRIYEHELGHESLGRITIAKPRPVDCAASAGMRRDRDGAIAHATHGDRTAPVTDMARSIDRSM
jgi:hypothetical protein